MTAKKKGESTLTFQHGGTHYKGMGIQPVEIGLANGLDCLQYSVVKYILRHKSRGRAEDLKKCIHFAQMALEHDYGVRSEVQYFADGESDAPDEKATKKSRKADKKNGR